MAEPPTSPWTREEIEDALSEAMSDVQDMDTSFGDYAKAAVRFLEKEGLLRLSKPGPTPEILFTTPDHPSSPRVVVCRGSANALPYMAVSLRLNGGMTEANAWLSADYARRVGEALIEQADVFSAASEVAQVSA